MFQKFQKNYQTKTLAKTWLQALRNREIAKNSFHATGDIKKAKIFADKVLNFTFKTDFDQTIEHVIFSADSLTVPLGYLFAFAAY